MVSEKKLDLMDSIFIWRNRYDKLEIENNKLKKVLEYYANDGAIQDSYEYNDDFVLITHDGVYSLYESGKRAKDLIQELEND